ncbi:endolytic transglycosylase MltG [Moraxella sp. ZJ142]|uniref:endolytic transglycosylase MltG n=1 Tax=Moraxella marmotae TaxID=3344520 RepID=UPI0035D48D7E
MTKSPKKSHNHRQSSKRKQPSRSNKLSFAKVLLVAVTAAVLLALVILYQSIYAKTSHAAQTIVVNQGDSYHSLLSTKPWSDSRLASTLVIKGYLALTADKPLQAGSYQIPENASLAQVVEIFNRGAKAEHFTLRIIEGKTLKDLYNTIKNTDGVSLELLSPPADGYAWADVMRDNEAVAKALEIDTPNGNLEGWFAPNTYQFVKGTTDTAILKRLYADQQQILEQAWQARDKDLPYDTPYQALIMASIIEKETGIKDERHLVSAVFVNRLRQGMKLQTDPTIIYGLFDRYDGKIYRSNIREKTEYNTYQIEGLPPTPIALPSAAAIEATMHPAESDVLFFVATGRGGHTFSRTYQEHEQAVAQYRATRK